MWAERVPIASAAHKLLAASLGYRHRQQYSHGKVELAERDNFKHYLGGGGAIMDERIRNFFSRSHLFDEMVTYQLAHIRPHWELIWDPEKNEYTPEEHSYAEITNNLIIEISKLDPPIKYHDNEDRLAEYCKLFLKWDIKKVGPRWIGSPYTSILEQGGFRDLNQKELCLAICGRIKAALDRGQLHFDDMEESHRTMLADVIAVTLFHRSDYS